MINIEKIKKELSKGDADEQYNALKEIKEFVANNLATEQALADNRATELQSKIDRINV